MYPKGVWTLLILVFAFAGCREDVPRGAVDSPGTKESVRTTTVVSGFYAVERRGIFSKTALKRVFLRPEDIPPSDVAGNELDERLETLKKGFQGLTEELQKIPDSEAFKKLQRDMDRLGEEIRRSGNDLRQKLQQDVLPRIERELEEFRRWLEEFNRGEAPKPLKI